MTENKKNANLEGVGDEGQLVVFALGEEEFGIDIHDVREIVRLPEIIPVPRSPEYVMGICNLRSSVLPVIDTRCRFDMEPIEHSDQTRMLVVESGKTTVGMVVDDMREVLRLHGTPIESTPGVCKGVDEEFLSGVVTLNKGKRLIMALNLDQIIDIEIEEGANGIRINGAQEKSNEKMELDEEEQLVSFQVGQEEYGMDINAVREILRVAEITQVPNVPDYVMGLFTIRKNLMPVVDMRALLGMESIVEQYLCQLDAIKDTQMRWVEELKSCIESGTRFTGETNPRNSDLGVWLDSFNTISQEVQSEIKKIREPHGFLYDASSSLVELAKTSREDALESYESKIAPLIVSVIAHLDSLKDSIRSNIHEDQRILVVDDGRLTVGYLVDHVNEVVRVPKSVINETPSIAATEKNEIRGVAKLDDGKRLILIMDQGSILSGTDSVVLSEIASVEEEVVEIEQDNDADAEAEEDLKTLAEQSLEEEQLVTFLLDKEEYGLRIMEVQEINRLEAMTEVPRAPSFIDGVTNLRGNIVPVLNIRTLFGMEARDADDKSRIIIVDLSGNKTGILVDQVKEVMRLSKSNIDKTPAIVSGAGNQFMDGICKLNGGERMVTLIDVSQLLSSEEESMFASMNAGTPIRPPATRKKAAKKTPTRKKPTKKKLIIAE